MVKRLLLSPSSTGTFDSCLPISWSFNATQNDSCRQCATGCSTECSVEDGVLVQSLTLLTLQFNCWLLKVFYRKPDTNSSLMRTCFYKKKTLEPANASQHKSSGIKQFDIEQCPKLWEKYLEKEIKKALFYFYPSIYFNFNSIIMVEYLCATSWANKHWGGLCVFSTHHPEETTSVLLPTGDYFLTFQFEKMETLFDRCVLNHTKVTECILALPFIPGQWYWLCCLASLKGIWIIVVYFTGEIFSVRTPKISLKLY